MLDVYFSNPGKQAEIKKQLIADITSAKNRLLVAVGFFTDTDILDAIRNKNLSTKKVILNKADLDRNNENGKEPIGATWAQEKLYVVSLGSNRGSISNNMHHKFAIIDNKLWIGTFNFTIGASMRNWECMIRIEDEGTLQKFVDEFYIMYRMGLISNELPNGTKLRGSKTIIKTKELIKDIRCTLCNQPVFNSHEHYIFKEQRYVQYGLFYNYLQQTAEQTIHTNETFFEVQCLGQLGVQAYPARDCDVCGKRYDGHLLTRCLFDSGYVNDDSVAFHDAYDPSIHKPESSIKLKCPECFVHQTRRYLLFESWEPGMKFPEY